MRLIDADELMNMMYHEAFETDSGLQKWDSGCWIRYKMLENVIKKVPRITGHMIELCENKNDKYDSCDQFVCSECGIELQGWRKVTEDDGETVCSEYEFRFCPNCGRSVANE